MKVGMNPITTTESIRNQYLKYLKSMFFLKDRELQKQAENLIEESGRFIRGPYMEITPPFISGATISDLVTEGVLSKEFKQINQHELPADRPLFQHQEQAIRLLVEAKRNIIVATGTGSGKTECFLIPIFDYLMKQKESGQLSPGVRALLLYPMNALANDQLARLRKLLSLYPDITFGRYTGETEEKEDAALSNFFSNHPGQTRLPNELLSRNEMRRTPPHILLTNYAMLEYLLLRPADNAFFDGEYYGKWHFLVLDEAHTYTGAKGSEIALLISRLKERITEKDDGKLQCIATSATLGGGKEHHLEVSKFGQDVFGEPFEITDIIRAARRKYYPTAQTVLRKSSEYTDMIRLVENGENKTVYKNLVEDARVQKLRQKLMEAPGLLGDVAADIFADEPLTQEEKEQAVVRLVSLCAGAKESDEDVPLLPARYHVFAKALEGAYTAFYPKKTLYLDRHKESQLSDGTCVPVFEIANCQRCGQEYIVGRKEADYLKQGDTYADEISLHSDPVDYYMISDHARAVLLDEDILVSDELNRDTESLNNVDEYLLCTACGYIHLSDNDLGENCCMASDPKILHVFRRHQGKGALNACFSCGSHTKGMIKRFVSADDAATEVLAESLYFCVSPQLRSDDKSLDDSMHSIEIGDSPFEDLDANDKYNEKNTVPELKDERGRKLLVFSDSRQDAAFFASFLNLKYNQNLWRYCILEVMRHLQKYEEIRLRDISSELTAYADRRGLFPEGFSPRDKEKMANQYLMKEFHVLDRQTGLEGLGLIAFDLPKPRGWPSLPAQEKALKVDSDGLWKIYTILFNTLRDSQATTYLSSVDARDDFFMPRNRPTYFSVSSAVNGNQTTVFRWLPAEGFSNRRLDYILRLLRETGQSDDGLDKQARQILNELMSIKGLIHFLVDGRAILISEANSQIGQIYRLNHEMWTAQLEPNMLYRCESCGTISLHSIHGVCTAYHCEGKLQPYSGEKTRFTYFQELYRDRKPVPLVSKEHTAQLNSQYALKLQNQFENGQVNVLSCSTTFEMGVDVGQLEAVFMRNVPPETANYIQRAGRAGRRTESTAFALTYAKKRSHDLTYYQNPKRIISGEIKPPHIVVRNEKIVLRHIFSVVFAWFFRNHEEKFDSVNEFFDLESGIEDSVVMLQNDLAVHPLELLASLKRIVPGEFPYFNHTDYWGWVGWLLNSKDGLLVTAKALLDETLHDLESLKQKSDAENKDTDRIRHIINTYTNKKIIQFLSSNNILPKYGFPIDVVDLDIISNSPEAGSIEISRDLKIAISEFAPGSEIIANGKIWKPYALKKATARGWPVFYYAICHTCKKVYSHPTTLGDIVENVLISCCKEVLHYYFYLKPIFGFTTDVSEPGTPRESRAVKSFTTRVLFDSYMKNDQNSYDEMTEEKGEVEIGKNRIPYIYSSKGQLLILNQGNNQRGFHICESCGYMTALHVTTMSSSDTKKSTKYRDTAHKTKLGRPCGNHFLRHVHFGHDFITDVLELRLPAIPATLTKFEGADLWHSVLYAILEGASLELGIARGEISGCLYYNDESEPGLPSLILFDEVPGGAGHVRRIAKSLSAILYQAKQKVSGGCGCGPETSCYGCLRNYSNQIYHEELSRGTAYEYLRSIQQDTLDDRTFTQRISTTTRMRPIIPPEPQIINGPILDNMETNHEWDDAIYFASSEKARQLALALSEENQPAPSIIGWEQFDEDLGVVGEIEFGWEDIHVAIITPEQSTSRAGLERIGWKVLMMNEVSPDQIVAALKGENHVG